MMRFSTMAFGMALTLTPILAISQAQAASPAEAYVTQNVDKGLAILNDSSLSKTERQQRFQAFLEKLTDIDRIAKFALGNARRTASAGDITAFNAAFRNYVIAVYQSYFSKYTGQTLKVTGSVPVGPGDEMVKSQMLDPKGDNSQPIEVDFRVKSDTGKMQVVDVSVGTANGGVISLAVEERDQFSAFLSQHNGSVPALVTHLNQLTANTKARRVRPARSACI